MLKAAFLRANFVGRVFHPPLRRGFLWICSLAVFTMIGQCVAWADIPLSTSTASVQNFDGVGSSATAPVPADFRVDALSVVRTVGSFSNAGAATQRAGGANLSTSAGNGIYNFGSGATSAGGTDRAIGFLSSGTATFSGNLYAQLVNNTGGDLSGLQISYSVEKYRNGSNPAGFRIQMFYSLDGSTWTNAGNSFLTSFAANADNTGFATAPGATAPVSGTLNVSIPNGRKFFLAWNYSVASGTTTTNAQALAVDDISILGIAGSTQTNPAGTGAANPNPVQAGHTTLLTTTVTPGTNPASTGLAVTGNLSAIGGAATQPFFDDGTHGDLVAGDNIFSFLATVPANTNPGSKTIPETITDAQSRTGSASISLNVTASSTPPTGTGSAVPNSLAEGGTTLLTVQVTPGSNPASTSLSVVADLSSIGGSSAQQFFDDGTHGDATPNDNVFSFQVVLPANTPGPRSLPVTISDAQGRSSATTISLTVQSPPAPNTVKISQVYGGGGNSGSTYTHDFIEIYNQQSTPIDISSWSVQYNSAGATGAWQSTNLCPPGVDQNGNAVPRTCSLLPGHYYLIQESQGAGGTTSLPAADITGMIALSATSGKVALVAGASVLSGACPTDSSVVDLVGYGSANCSESAPTPALSNTTAAVRKGNGCIDTENNVNDFVIVGPIPRNSAAPANSCGGDPTRPSGLGIATPASLEPASDVLLTVKVTPATAPPSTAIAVVTDLTAIGGASLQQLYDDGTHGDQTAGDNVFSFQATIAPFIPTGAKNLVAAITDAEGRTATAPITLTVQSPTCGVERWSVKTGTDPDAVSVDLGNPRPATIADLGAIPPPAVPPDNARVAPTETTVFVVNGTMTLFKKETDVDYHIVVQDDSGHTIISEIPSPACVAPSSPFAPAVAAARAKFNARLTATPQFQTVSIPVQIKGVGFFDFIHGQTGVAPNGIELHPVLDVNFTNTTTTNLASNPNPAQFGQRVAITATVSNPIDTPTGNVTFFEGGVSLGSIVLDPAGRATLTTTALSVGSHSLVASYEGDTKSAPSTSAQLIQVVNKADQAINFGPIPDSTFGGGDFTVSANSSSGLPVSFSIVSGPAALSGNTVHITGAGNVTVRASQAGDNSYNPAPDVDRSFTVAKTNQAIVFAALPDRTLGDPPFTVSASGGGSNNPVTFAASGNCTAGGSNGSTVALTGTGPCTVTASQAGDSNYNAAPDVSRTFTIFAPPVLNLPATITAEATSPGGTTVSYTATATDVTDGTLPAICTPISGSVFPLGSTTVDCSFTNSRNKTVTGSFVIRVVDTTSPVIQCMQPDSAWHGSDVTLSCTASDSGSGLRDAADAAFTLSTNVAPGIETQNAATESRQVCDLSQNCAQAGPIGGIKVDKKPPTLNALAAVNGSPFVSGGWTNQPVIVTFACADGGSGVASSTSPVTLTAEGANQSASGNCTDAAGNSSSATFSGINIDRTAPNPPTVGMAPPPNGNGWNNTNVVVTFSSNGDTGPVQSGVVSCTAPTTIASETSGTNVSGACRDLAGNVSSSAATTVKIDTTTPAVSILGVTNGAVYVLGAVPAASCFSTDALSGIAMPATLNIAGGNSQHVGNFVASCAGATDKAGNLAAPVSVQFSVQYIFVGFLHDGDEDEDKGKESDNDDGFKAGRTIPLKWELRVADGSFVKRLSAIQSIQFAPNPSCAPGGEGTAVNANSHSGLELDGVVYEFDWQTKGLARGCYSVMIGLDDQTVRSRVIQLR